MLLQIRSFGYPHLQRDYRCVAVQVSAYSYHDVNFRRSKRWRLGQEPYQSLQQHEAQEGLSLLRRKEVSGLYVCIFFEPNTVPNDIAS